MDSNTKSILGHTALGAVILGIGLFLFAFDMRTVRAPAEHIFLADVATCFLGVIAVGSGVPAIAMQLAERRGMRGY